MRSSSAGASKRGLPGSQHRRECLRFVIGRPASPIAECGSDLMGRKCLDRWLIATRLFDLTR